jgi:alkylated DNA repair dioxygenase AlkB
MNNTTPLSYATCEGSRRQVLLRKRTYDEKKRKWSPWDEVATRSDFSAEHSPCRQVNFLYKFPGNSGKLVIYANLIPSNRQEAVTDELMQCSNFRQYSIQGNPEPRTHFLLHDNATDDFDGEPQPGYRYGCIRMKSRPLHEMTEIQKLSVDMQKIYTADDGCYWNIGVNPVLYRDGRDRMGYHADDDQGEEIILTVLVSSPVDATRRISIRRYHFKSKGNMDGDEELELMLDAGDAYSMDGKQNQCIARCCRWSDPVVCDAPWSLQKILTLTIPFRWRSQVKCKSIMCTVSRVTKIVLEAKTLPPKSASPLSFDGDERKNRRSTRAKPVPVSRLVCESRTSLVTALKACTKDSPTRACNYWISLLTGKLTAFVVSMHNDV